MSEGVAAASAVGPPPGMDVRLSSNESAYGPSPKAIEAQRAAAAEAHRYPDDQSLALRGRLAEAEGVALERLAVGTGSAGLLMDIIGHLCPPSAPGNVVAFDRAFVVYRLAAANAAAEYREAPVGPPATTTADGYQRDVDALLSRVGADTRAVVVDNPGNPTGQHLTGAQLQRLAAELDDGVVLVVDEAYHDFATGQRGYATVDELALDHPRVLVVRTMSKAHGLAGLCVGWLTGPADLVGEIDARRVRFNLAAPAQAAAIASLDDPEHLASAVEGTLAGRARMAAALRELGAAFTDGLGNFLLVELDRPAEEVVAAFAERGVGVRSLPPYALDRQVRISVGTPPEVDRFIDAARAVLG